MGLTLLTDFAEAGTDCGSFGFQGLWGNRKGF